MGALHLLRTRYGIAILTIASLLSLSACQTKTESQALAPGAVVIDSVASADGVPIHYMLRQGGPHALVFVHCWSCDQSYWETTIAALDSTYTVVTLDLAGHGQSGADRAEWNMTNYGADVAAVVKKLDLKDVILVGHSMGGTVILEAARQLLGRITAVVGVDTYQDLEHARPEDQTAALLTPLRADFVSGTDAFVRGIFGPQADSVLVAMVAADMASAPPDLALASLASLATYTAAESLKATRLAIRCINSDQYPTNVEAGRRVGASFAVKIVPGVGHFVHMEDPETFNAFLLETIHEFWPVQ